MNRMMILYKMKTKVKLNKVYPERKKNKFKE